MPTVVVLLLLGQLSASGSLASVTPPAGTAPVRWPDVAYGAADDVFLGVSGAGAIFGQYFCQYIQLRLLLLDVSAGSRAFDLELPPLLIQLRCDLEVRSVLLGPEGFEICADLDVLLVPARVPFSTFGRHQSTCA